MKAYVEVLGVRFNVTSRVGRVFLAAFLTLMASFLLIGAYQAGEESQLLATEGIAIEATVIEKHRSRSGSRTRRHSNSYHIRLAYTPPGMARVEVDESFSRSRYEAVDVGDRMTIRYAPSRPRVHEFSPGDKASVARRVWWLAVGSAFGAMGAAVWAWRQWGQPVPATDA
jgi:hypothetical protein